MADWLMSCFTPWDKGNSDALCPCDNSEIGCLHALSPHRGSVFRLFLLYVLRCREAPNSSILAVVYGGHEVTSFTNPVFHEGIQGGGICGLTEGSRHHSPLDERLETRSCLCGTFKI